MTDALQAKPEGRRLNPDRRLYITVTLPAYNGSKKSQGNMEILRGDPFGAFADQLMCATVDGFLYGRVRPERKEQPLTVRRR